MKKKYIVTLTQEERQELQTMLSKGRAAARKLAHARILLKADASEGGPAWNDDAIGEGLRSDGRPSSGCESSLSKKVSRRHWIVASRVASISGSWMETARRT